MRPPVQAFCCIFASLLLVLGWWAQRGQPHLVTQQGAPQVQLPCVSYSPFRHPGVNPFNFAASVSREQIEADLRRLQSVTNCVRTYGLAQGLDQVPSVARQLGMRMKLGLWISRDALHNQREIARGMALATEFGDVIDLVIVGNEVLLRRELTAAQLGHLLQQAKLVSPRPISYADVWEFWQRHDTLAQYVHEVTVHILPYWEDEPVTNSLAVGHVANVALNMQRHFAPKLVWVGETGWPAQGRQRAGAVPSVVGQTQFMRELATAGTRMPLNFNVIEAFDQPWKRSFEGAMGGYWGLFDQFGQARVTFFGPVVEDAFWWRGWLGALMGGGMTLLLLALARGREMAAERRLHAATLAAASALLGALAPLQWQASMLWDRTLFESCISLGLALLGALATLSSVWQINDASLPVQGAQSRHLRWTVPRMNLAIAAALRQATLFAASSAALIVLLDPRYRPFPTWWFFAPTLAWWSLRIGRPSVLEAATAQAKLLAWVLALSAVGIALQEGWRNSQALAYSGVLVALSAAVLLPIGGWRSRAKTNAANSAAGAHS
jgi:exo-beta-1,3-glucanase (GH17 family)